MNQIEDTNSRVQKVLQDLIRDEGDIGLQVAAYLDGKLVIDTCAGLADQTNQRPTEGETLFNSFSISKGIVSTCVHILADRGLIDYDDPISDYWPEFAARGKEKATIRHALTHRVGIPNDPQDISIELMSNWNAVCQSIAKMEPLWEPGTRISYHPLTYGWILGEVVHRVDGRSFSQFLQDEVCQPLSISDMYFGVPPKKEYLVAILKNAPDLTKSLVDFGIPVTSPMSDLAGTFNLSEIRRAVIPGAGLITNARSLARHYAILANGGELDGVRLLSKERIKIATAPESEDPEKTEIRWWTAHSLGYTLGGGSGLREEMPHSFGYEGVGTIGFADPDRRFSFAILKNLLDISSSMEMISASRVLQTVTEVLEIN
jgi:CubicO group peptidase (beta-lactamase class C family)